MTLRNFFSVRGSLLSVLVLFTCAIGIRLLLIIQGWPITDSDESTMGLAARHIAHQGEHPIFFYGQHYMGTLEAYIGAALFRLFGPSVVSLRLGLLLLYCGFLLSTYLLTSLLYSKLWALVTVGLLSLGSSFMLLWQLTANGGYTETLLFGSLSFLLACWLSFSYRSDLQLSRQPRRLLAYGCYGIVLGLGLWSDLLIAPFALCSFSLLLIFCWRELMHVLGVGCLLLGLLLGFIPLLAYNLNAPAGENSLSVFWQLYAHGQSNATLSLLLEKLFSTVQFGIPMMTGETVCLSTKEGRFFTLGATSLCSFSRYFWGSGYLLLLALALVISFTALLRARHQSKRYSPGLHIHAQYLARLLFLASVVLTLIFYLTSNAPLAWSDNRARYLIGLLIATPAVFFPLWQGLRFSRLFTSPALRRIKGLRASIIAALAGILGAGRLLFLASMLMLGTIFTFGSVPTTRVINQQQSDLITHLEHLSIAHIYTDYWTCDKIAFLSEERITCEVVDRYLIPSSTYSRYAPYIPAVRADPHAAYVFPPGLRIPLSTQQHFAQLNYQHDLIDGYLVYQPTT